QRVVGGGLGRVGHRGPLQPSSGVGMVVELADRDECDQRERGQQEELLASGHPTLPLPRTAPGARGAGAGSERTEGARTPDLIPVTRRLRKTYGLLSQI